MMIKTKYTTADGLAVYDLAPELADLCAVAGPDGHTGQIDPDDLPEGFRWVTADEWEALDKASEGLTVFTYEFMGRIPKHGSEVAQTVCNVLQLSGSKEGTVTELVARKAAGLLNDDMIDDGGWDSDCVLAVVANCSFTAMN